MGLQNRSDFAGRKNSRSRMRKRARPFQIAPGKPKEMHDIQTGDGETLMKVVREIVHVNQTPEDIAATDGEEPLLIEWNGVRSNNGATGMNTDRILKLRTAPVFEPPMAWGWTPVAGGSQFSGST